MFSEDLLNAGQEADPIPEVTAKFERALTHGLELVAALREYQFSLKVTGPEVVSNRKENAYVVTAHIPPPPLVLSLLLGDLLNNLRSSLDYLARQLVIDAGNSPIDRGRGKTQFPILLQPLDLQAQGLLGVDPRALLVIDCLQPYRVDSSKEHPLAILALLNNIDKHRLLNILALSGSGNVVFVPVNVEDVAHTEGQHHYHLELLSGVPQIIKVEPHEMFAEARVNAVGIWVHGVVLGEPGTSLSQGLERTVVKLLDYVGDEVIGRLRHYLQRPRT